jgi:hypothetical protein
VAWVVSAVVGVNTRQAVAYQITGFLTALLALAFFSSLRMRTPLRVQRQRPRYATVDTPFSYRLTVSQPSSSSSSPSGAARRNWFDRSVGYYRWAWLVRLNSVARITEIRVAEATSTVAHGAAATALKPELTVINHCTPHARGVLGMM